MPYGAIRRLRNLALVTSLALPVAAAAEPLTLVAFGDSLTQGYGLPPDQGLVPQLQAWLRAQGADVTVINAGVSGDTTAGGASRIDWTLTPEVDAMILTLGGNDMLRGIDPAEARRNLDTILTATEARDLPVLVVPMLAPGNYGPDYKRDFDAMYQTSRPGTAPFLPTASLHPCWMRGPTLARSCKPTASTPMPKAWP